MSSFLSVAYASAFLRISTHHVFATVWLCVHMSLCLYVCVSVFVFACSSVFVYLYALVRVSCEFSVFVFLGRLFHCCALLRCSPKAIDFCCGVQRCAINLLDNLWLIAVNKTPIFPGLKFDGLVGYVCCLVGLFYGLMFYGVFVGVMLMGLYVLVGP